MIPPTVDIVLATYNGVRYLPEQLASLAAQTYPHWRLLVRDDGSTDGTCALLEEFSASYPGRVCILPPGRGDGAVANFGHLLAATTALYVMCCDQDDVWDSTKISLSLEQIQRFERENGPAVPLLVHTDLRVADSNLKQMAASFWTYTKLYPQQELPLSRLLVQNVVTGCTLICNRALLERALPIPKEALMHDWWLALVSSACGYIHAVDTATITYRQHSNNAVGAQQFGTLQYFKRAWRRRRQLAAQKRAQANALLLHPALDLSAKDQKTLQTYLSLHQRNPLMSRYLAWRHHFTKQGVFRQITALVMLRQP
jgi:glycosyltransferase involved in cell wall biosynthesis